MSELEELRGLEARLESERNVRLAAIRELSGMVGCEPSRKYNELHLAIAKAALLAVRMKIRELECVGKRDDSEPGYPDKSQHGWASNPKPAEAAEDGVPFDDLTDMFVLRHRLFVLTTERDTLKAELSAMRPVVEAARGINETSWRGGPNAHAVAWWILEPLLGKNSCALRAYDEAMREIKDREPGRSVDESKTAQMVLGESDIDVLKNNVIEAAREWRKIVNEDDCPTCLQIRGMCTYTLIDHALDAYDEAVQKIKAGDSPSDGNPPSKRGDAGSTPAPGIIPCPQCGKPMETTADGMPWCPNCAPGRRDRLLYRTRWDQAVRSLSR